MKNPDKPDIPCSCGGNMSGTPPMGPPCPSKSTLFSKEELEILAKLRALKEEARRLKVQLEKTEDEQEKRICEDRLGKVRKEWEELKRKGEEAARQRMIYLGHLEPDK